MVDEVADITFHQSMKILMDAILESIRTIFQASEEQSTRFTGNFISRLQEYMQNPLLVATVA